MFFKSEEELIRILKEHYPPEGEDYYRQTNHKQIREKLRKLEMTGDYGDLLTHISAKVYITETNCIHRVLADFYSSKSLFFKCALKSCPSTFKIADRPSITLTHLLRKMVKGVDPEGTRSTYYYSCGSTGCLNPYHLTSKSYYERNREERKIRRAKKLTNEEKVIPTNTIEIPSNIFWILDTIGLIEWSSGAPIYQTHKVLLGRNQNSLKKYPLSFGKGG